MSDAPDSLSDFTGVARLFPLPNVVLFPHVVQPLHIFEPRYRKMTQDALEGDRLVAMVLLRPGWEEDYEGRPPVHDVACLGRIMNEHRLPDGKYNLLLRGLCRLRLEEEVPSGTLYRTAQGWPLPDSSDPADPSELRGRLVEVVKAWLPQGTPFAGQLETLAQTPLPLGALCDVLGFALPFAVEVKQGLLEELDVELRARQLLQALAANPPPELIALPKLSKYPPEFNSN